MTRILFCIFMLATFFFACTSKNKGNAAATAQLIKLNDLYDSALIHRDLSVLKRLYADEFVYTNPEGKLLSKEQQTTSIGSSEINWQESKSNDVRVRIYGKMAILTGVFSAKGTYRENPITVHESYTAVWIKTDTSWQIVAEQGNVVK